MDHLPPIRLAPLGGKVSWKTTTRVKARDVIFRIQTQRALAFVSKALFKPWRIVATPAGNLTLVGRVIAEYDSQDEAEIALTEFVDITTNGFDESVNVDDLKDGDVISVPTGMGHNNRHWGVFVVRDGERFVVEYQGHPKAGGLGLLPQIASIPKGTTGLTDLRRVRFIYALDDASDRALSKVGAKKYHFLTNNCETFATWAKTDVGRSTQASHWMERALDVAEKILATGAILTALTVFAQVAGIAAICCSALGIGQLTVFISSLLGSGGVTGVGGLLTLLSVGTHLKIASGKQY